MSGHLPPPVGFAQSKRKRTAHCPRCHTDSVFTEFSGRGVSGWAGNTICDACVDDMINKGEREFVSLPCAH